MFSMGLVLAACVTTPAPSGLPGFSFDYSLQDREATGLVQAFDDGRNTYLQFADWSQGTPQILDGTGHALSVHRAGSYAVLDGRYDRIRVVYAGGESTVQTGSLAFTSQAATSKSARSAPSPEGVALLAKRAEIATLELQIATLEIQLALARSAESELADKLVIHFADNSARVNVDLATLQGIAAAVRPHDHVLVAGYTDASYPDNAGEALARRRAVNVERALLAQGVPSSHLSIAYHAAGMFAVDNHSEDGRARNRRVEITIAAPES